jgi:hypothetical protein
MRNVMTHAKCDFDKVICQKYFGLFSLSVNVILFILLDSTSRTRGIYASERNSAISMNDGSLMGNLLKNLVEESKRIETFRFVNF